jgi:3-hydroxyisobutyrate dehydrogenase-like beta-hydroxyacid dehydrogenase
MLADDKAVEHVVLGKGGIVANLPKSAIHISSSTISVGLAEAHRSARKGRAAFCLSACFGRPDAAAAGKLFVAAAGDAAVLLDCMPLLEAIGQRTIILSRMPSAANLVKLSGNFLIAYRNAR